jgi:hypothetical protein
MGFEQEVAEERGEKAGPASSALSDLCDLLLSDLRLKTTKTLTYGDGLEPVQYRLSQ